MDRSFDHSQKILLAVELDTSPRSLKDMPAGYSLFQRVPILDIERAAANAENLAPRVASGKFHDVLSEHMGYWEKHVPAGKQCHVHYVRGSDEVISSVYERLKGMKGAWTLLGIYHSEPQCSAYPASFPVSPAPLHWAPGEQATFTKESIFWFNFFPSQLALFEKTFIVWASFQLFQQRERGECNILCASEGKERLQVQGVDEFVQVNLNRFSNLQGYLTSAQESGKQTFTVDRDYRWYGMLLRRLG